MQRGTVKFFNLAKGYGVLRPDEGGDDIFVHVIQLGKSGITSLDRGHRVEFDLELDPRSGKFRATNLRVVDAEGEAA